MLNTDAFQILKKGSLLPVKQGNSLGVFGKANEHCFKPFLEIYSSYIEERVLLISEIGQLSMFLQKVPELAWDIVEYAEKSLQIVFPDGRNVPSFALRNGADIAIRLERSGILHKVVYNAGGSLLFLRLNSSILKTDFLSQYDKILNLQENFEWQIIPERSMSLGINGEIKIY